MTKQEEIIPRTPEAEEEHKKFLQRCGIDLKRLEIRGGIAECLRMRLAAIIVKENPHGYELVPEAVDDVRDDILAYLHSQGVVIKVGSDAPELTCYDKLGDEPETKVLYVATQPLIEEKE